MAGAVRRSPNPDLGIRGKKAGESSVGRKGRSRKPASDGAWAGVERGGRPGQAGQGTQGNAQRNTEPSKNTRKFPRPF